RTGANALRPGWRGDRPGGAGPHARRLAHPGRGAGGPDPRRLSGADLHGLRAHSRRPVRRTPRSGVLDGHDPHGDVGAGPTGADRLRFLRSRGLYARHGSRAGLVPGPRGRAHRRALAGAVTGAEALSAFLAHLAQERRASPRTVEAYAAAGRRYLAFLERHRGEGISLAGLGEVTAAEIRAFLAHLRSGERPLSPRSMSQQLSAIRTFHRFLDRRLGVANAAIGLVRGPRVKPGAP